MKQLPFLALLVALCGCTMGNPHGRRGAIAPEITAACRSYFRARAEAFDELAASPPETATKLVEAINASAKEDKAKLDEVLRSVLERSLPNDDEDRLPDNVRQVLQEVSRGYRGATR